MLILIYKGVPTKLLKNFLIEDFFHLPPVSTLSCEYLFKLFKKLEMVLTIYSGAWKKLIHEKNQKSEISWQSCDSDTLSTNSLALLFFKQMIYGSFSGYITAGRL
jgi:hypothetical protein